MSLDQGTCLCLILGVVALSLTYRTLVLPAMKGLHQYTFTTPSAQIMAQPEAVVEPKVADPVVPAAQPARTLSTQEDAERIQEQLEAQNRHEWCKKYQELEAGRYFRERFYQHEQTRQYNDERRREAAHRRLESLRDRRQIFQESMNLDWIVQNTGFSGLPA